MHKLSVVTVMVGIPWVSESSRFICKNYRGMCCFNRSSFLHVDLAFFVFWKLEYCRANNSEKRIISDVYV